MITGAFIFISKSASSDKHNAEMFYGKEQMKVFGVSSVEEGITVAKRLVEDDDCRVIELCGGFGEKGARAVREAVNAKVPVGYIVYFPEDTEIIDELISDLNSL